MKLFEMGYVPRKFVKLALKYCNNYDGNHTQIVMATDVDILPNQILRINPT